MSEEPRPELRVAFVCTGNRCRSPYAALRLRQFTDGLGVEVISEGTLRSPGHRAPDDLVAIAAVRGLDMKEHRSVPIGPGSLADADLVIGFEFDHVASAVVDGGARPDRTFILPELTRLLLEVEHRDPDEPRLEVEDIIAAAHARRAPDGFTSTESVVDPFGGPYEGYVAMAEELDGHLKVLVERLFGREL